MSHGFEMEPAKGPAIPDQKLIALLSGILDKFNQLLMNLAMLALVLTACILTYSVISRYFFKAPTDWQDEASVFMLVGVTFFCTAYVQSYRGHIGIEALASLLPAKVNAFRMLLVDVLSFLFCAFFSWKSWTLWHEAFVDGQTTTSTFAPPLWIPYGMMAFGMSLLTLQIFVQVLARLTNQRGAK
ncbi:TRAP transporter small permease [Undibacterium sp. Jales W-56]|uniref:TRAP transporter small permease n=1 Tax=Undibacterium sp. Jales W-56 TaxID=2897325 RepID=UPI0021D26FB5|nr:TRAP transporter small permease [Undibacterium sp. Jales W-56]MCU6434493.1 TRAP transporter small permease [Undibacterium sp. Jales W-56]